MKSVFLVRREAILAIASIGPASAPAIPALKASLNNEAEDMRAAARAAMKRIVSPGESIPRGPRCMA